MLTSSLQEAFTLSDKDERAMDWLAIIAQLGDFARVRMLRLLEEQELGVGELARIVQLPQSTVSRHLKALHDHNWIVKRSEGTASLYRLHRESLEDDQLQIWETTSSRIKDNPSLVDDHLRLQEVVASRRVDTRDFFGKIGGEWHDIRRDLFGTGFGFQALLGMLNPDLNVADLGCGTGDVSVLLAPVVSNVCAVDREPAMLEACKKRLKEYSNVECVQADLTSLPFDDETFDAAVIMLVLHHMSNPVDVIAEAGRSIRPGGVLLVVDMVDHDRDDYRVTMGHEHLGFSEEELQSWADTAGFRQMRYRRMRPHTEGRGPGLFAAALFK